MSARPAFDPARRAASERIDRDGPLDASAVVVLSLSLSRALALSLALSLTAIGCSAADAPSSVASVGDHHDDSDDRADRADPQNAIGHVSSPLNANDTVATAVAQSCTTTAVKGLAVQLVEEIQCMRPSTFSKIDNTPGLALGSAVFPYLQTKAASALIAAQKARGTTMSINSALRTLPQQYLLYRWYQTGRCGIGLAASPGTSNHEGAIAVDIDDNAGWRASMQSKSFQWLGASDPVHYDFVGGGTVDLHGLSVTAFQRLWNRNNPSDTITEDGSYGPGTAARLAQSPAAGFAKGADCKPAPDAGADAADPTKSSPSAAIPDGKDAPTDGNATPPQTTAGAFLGPTTRGTPDTGGCAIVASGPHGSFAGLLLAIAAAIVLGARRRTG